MNILALGVRPRDVEDGCGGTLSLFSGLGHTVFRVAAIGSSAALQNSSYLCLDFDEETLIETRESRLRFIDLVRHCRADVILTHYRQDPDPLNALVGRMVNDIAVMIPIEKLPTPSKPNEKIPVYYGWDPTHGQGFIPTDYVDISGVMEQKRSLLAQHALESGNGCMKLAESSELKARMRGLQCGVSYAEGFVISNDAFRIPSSRMLP